MRDLSNGASGQIFRTLQVLAAAALFAGPASAQELLVHLPLDGSIDNAGSGGNSVLFGQPPVAVQGHVGNAMKFDGRSVIAVPVDLSAAEHPQVTVTAWVRADETAPNTDHTVVSSGTQGTTPALRVAKRRSGIKASMRGGRAALLAGDFSPTEEWVFMAGTVDIPAQALHLVQAASAYDRDGIRTNSLYAASRHANPNDDGAEPQAWVFIGALTFDTDRAPAVGIAIDDVRVYSGVLGDTELASIRDDAAGQTVAGAGVDLPGGSDDGLTMPDNQSPTAAILRERQGAGSSDQADIERLDAPDGVGSDNTGEQPALTGAADSQRQLPDQEQIADQATAAARREAEARAVEREEAAQSSSGNGMTLEEYNEQQASRNADQVSGIDHESPQGTLARDGTTQEPGADENEQAPNRTPEPDAGPMSPVGQIPIGEYLHGIEFGGPPTGNVRDCTSFAEIVRDVATEFRDKVVEFAATNACELLTLPVRRSRVAQVLESAEGYETNEFRQALLEETYGRCLSGTTMASRLPEAMIGFWNERIANNSWATIGPRKLDLGTTQSGTLVSPGDRKFITPSPVYQQNSAFLSLQERSGSARVNTRVCTVSLFNRYQRLVSFSVNETPEERQDQSQYVVYDLDNLAMRFLIVHLDGAGLIGRRFQYDLMVQ